MEIEIDPTEEYFQTIYSILKELKTKQLESRSDNVLYNIRLFPPEKGIDKQTIFRDLENEGILSWNHEEGAYGVKVGEDRDPDFRALWCIELKLHEPEFTELYDKYKICFRRGSLEGVVIYDNGAVELYLDGSSYHNKFGVNTRSFNLLVYLAEHQGKLKTLKEIEDELGYSNRQARDAAAYLVGELGYKGTNFLITDNGFKLLCSVVKKS